MLHCNVFTKIPPSLGRTTNNIGLLVYALLLLLPIEVLFAQQSDKDDQHKKMDRAPPTLKFSGELELVSLHRSNFNLNTEDEEGLSRMEFRMELGMSYKLSEQLSLFSNLTLEREIELKNDSDETIYHSSAEIDEAYIKITELFEADDLIQDVSLYVGRVNIEDSRSWLYDETLDGIALELELDSTETDIGLSINREEIFFGSNLVNNAIFYAEHEPFEDSDIHVSAHAIFRDDQSADSDSPKFYALRSTGNVLDDHLLYWADFAWVRGKNNEKTIRGKGFDLGVTYTLGDNSITYFTLGYAFGSGDGDPDSDFRQTDLQSNTGEFGGVTNFKYYGELMDPELSNMHIYTAGIGFRPNKNLSIDFIYHHYQQDLAIDEIRNSDLDMDPEGDNKHLGDELDMVIGIELSKQLETELSLGYFHPGSAFEEDANAAYLANVKITFDF